MTMYKAAGGDPNFSVIDANDDYMKNWFDTYLKPYLSLQKICYNSPGCWNQTGSFYLNGSTAQWSNVNGIGSNIITAVLSDGTLIDLDVAGQGGQLYGVVGSTGVTLFLYFDINGVKKPNMFGKDIFVTVYYKGNLVPAYYGSSMDAVKNDCKSTGKGASCIRLYLQNNM